MRELDKVIEVLNDIVPESDIEIEDTKQAITYLESLKPSVPSYVSDWFEKLNELEIYNLMSLHTETKMPNDVWCWFSRLGPAKNLVMTDIIRFGYRVLREKQYVIGSITPLGRGQKYFVLQTQGNDGYAYQFTTDFDKATRFSESKAIRVMRHLRVNWELYIVEGE